MRGARGAWMDGGGVRVRRGRSVRRPRPQEEHRASTSGRWQPALGPVPHTHAQAARFALIPGVPCWERRAWERPGRERREGALIRRSGRALACVPAAPRALLSVLTPRLLPPPSARTNSKPRVTTRKKAKTMARNSTGVSSTDTWPPPSPPDMMRERERGKNGRAASRALSLSLSRRRAVGFFFTHTALHFSHPLLPLAFTPRHEDHLCRRRSGRRRRGRAGTGGREDGQREREGGGSSASTHALGGPQACSGRAPRTRPNTPPRHILTRWAGRAAPGDGR